MSMQEKLTTLENSIYRLCLAHPGTKCDLDECYTSALALAMRG